jgi:hypothetical protein
LQKTSQAIDGYDGEASDTEDAVLRKVNQLVSDIEKICVKTIAHRSQDFRPIFHSPNTPLISSLCIELVSIFLARGNVIPDLIRGRFVFGGALGFPLAYNPGNFSKTFGFVKKDKGLLAFTIRRYR